LDLFLALISLGFLTPMPAMAGTISPLPYTAWNAPIIIEAYSVHYGIEAKPLIDTMYCESRFAANAIGDKGTSFGIAQIHLSSHPGITREEALNPFFAIDWAASQFAAGNQNIWSCYRTLYGGKSP
jgi:hypothetical protein